MTDQPVSGRPDGRVVRGDTNDTLYAEEQRLSDWLRRNMKPEAFVGPNVVLPREAMEGLVSMARGRGFVIDAPDG